MRDFGMIDMNKGKSCTIKFFSTNKSISLKLINDLLKQIVEG